jgi:predicted XRE-type DNA-binding protein
MTGELEFTRSSGNPFADLGMADTDLRLAKARLAQQVTAVMRVQGLTQSQVAERMGIDQPQLSRITRGLLRDFSLEKLIELVRRLDMDIEISVTPNRELSREGRVIVSRVAHAEDGIAATRPRRPEKVRFD